MGMEQILKFMEDEYKKRDVSETFKEIQEDVYENLIIKSAMINSLDIATNITDFVKIDSSSILSKQEELKNEFNKDKNRLTNLVDSLAVESNKADFIKIVKKTKFLKREPLTHDTFQKINDYTKNILTQMVNEELVLLSPYKISKLVSSEMRDPSIHKFTQLYSPETINSNIDNWLIKHGKKTDDFQQIKVHYNEISSIGFLAKQTAIDMAIRWSTMIGLSGDTATDEDTINAVDEALELIKIQATLF